MRKRTVNYGVVMVSRNLEKANENNGFKMTALECWLIVIRFGVGVLLFFACVFGVGYLFVVAAFLCKGLYLFS